jgi:hypothetical protein
MGLAGGWRLVENLGFLARAGCISVLMLLLPMNLFVMIHLILDLALHMGILWSPSTNRVLGPIAQPISRSIGVSTPTNSCLRSILAREVGLLRRCLRLASEWPIAKPRVFVALRRRAIAHDHCPAFFCSTEYPRSCSL